MNQSHSIVYLQFVLQEEKHAVRRVSRDARVSVSRLRASPSVFAVFCCFRCARPWTASTGMLGSRLEARGCEVEFVTDLNGSTDRQGSLRTLQAALAGGYMV